MRVQPTAIAVAAAILAVGSSVVSAQQPMFYTFNSSASSLCSAFIPNGYSIVNYYSQAAVEQSILTQLAAGKALLPLIPQDCYVNVLQLTCVNSFPQFNGTAKLNTCQSLCVGAAYSCVNFLAGATEFVQNLSPNLQTLFSQFFNFTCSDASQYAAAQCSAPAPIPAAVNELVEAQPACPAPLIYNPLSNGSSVPLEANQVCIGQCCAACPISYNLYGAGVLATNQRAEYALHIISFFASLFVAVSYLFLPDKRKIPAAFILNLSICLVIFHMASFFPVGNPNKVLCRDPITQATQQDTPICSAQAFILIYGILSTASWFYFLVLNLHMNIVWRSKSLKHGFIVIHAICWIVPLILTVAPLAANAVTYEYGSFCLVNQNWRNAILFYPLAVFIFAAFLLNLVTSAKIFQISRATNLDIKEVIGLQLRPFIYSLGYLFIFLFFWIFDFTAASNLARDSMGLFVSWANCIIVQGNSQDQCYENNKSALPSVGVTITADVLVSVVGLWTFIFFGAKKQILVEWYQLITGEKPGSQTNSENMEMSKASLQRSSTAAVLVEKEPEDNRA